MLGMSKEAKQIAEACEGVWALRKSLFYQFCKQIKMYFDFICQFLIAIYGYFYFYQQIFFQHQLKFVWFWNFIVPPMGK